jgi:hypothetical protein
LIAGELAQRGSSGRQPQYDFYHKQKVLIVVVELVLELMSHQLLQESAALVELFRLKNYWKFNESGEEHQVWHLAAKVEANEAVLVEQALAAPNMQRELP